MTRALHAGVAAFLVCAALAPARVAHGQKLTNAGFIELPLREVISYDPLRLDPGRHVRVGWQWIRPADGSGPAGQRFVVLDLETRKTFPLEIERSAVCGGGCTAVLVGYRAGGQATFLVSHRGSPSSPDAAVAWSPGERRRLWETPLAEGGRFTRVVGRSADGRKLFLQQSGGGVDMTILRLDLDSGAVDFRHSLPAEDGHAIASDNGAWVVVMTYDERGDAKAASRALAYVVDVARATHVTLPAPFTAYGAVIDPDGRRLVMVSAQDCELTAWDVAARKQVARTKTTCRAHGLVLSADGQHVFVLGNFVALQAHRFADLKRAARFPLSRLFGRKTPHVFCQDALWTPGGAAILIRHVDNDDRGVYLFQAGR